MKNVLINGADGGLGEALVILFSKRGYHVSAITYKSLKNKNLFALPNVEIYLVDGFLDWEYRAQTIKTIVENLPDIDILINNLGHSLFGAFEVMSDHDIEQHFQASVFDLMRMIRVMIPCFRERHGGTLVNISSIAGLLAVPLDSLFHATEFAVEGFTESLAFELAPFGIKVRLVEPGGISCNFFNNTVKVEEHHNVYEAMEECVLSAIAHSRPNFSTPQEVAERVLEAVEYEGDQLRWVVGEDAQDLLAQREKIGGEAFLNHLREALGLDKIV